MSKVIQDIKDRAPVNRKLLAEMIEKNQLIKKEVITLLEMIDKPSIKKERIKDELFKIYMKMK